MSTVPLAAVLCGSWKKAGIRSISTTRALALHPTSTPNSRAMMCGRWAPLPVPQSLSQRQSAAVGQHARFWARTWAIHVSSEQTNVEDTLTALTTTLLNEVHGLWLRRLDTYASISKRLPTCTPRTAHGVGGWLYAVLGETFFCVTGYRQMHVTYFTWALLFTSNRLNRPDGYVGVIPKVNGYQYDVADFLYIRGW